MINEKNGGIWKTPYIPAIPESVAGIKSSHILLSDRAEADWKFLFEEIQDVPSAYAENQDYMFDKIVQEKWRDVTAPGSLIMQGFNIQNNVEYYYKRKISLPSDFVHKRVFIRFEGVYSNARVWVNNTFIRQHVGGFTCWDCDISKYAKKKEITLVIGVTDVEGDKKGPWNPEGLKVSDSAWASYYAHCNIGGIIRDVTLFALPQNYVARSHIDTTFSNNYQTAELNAEFEIHSASSKIKLTAQVIDKEGNVIQGKAAVLGDTHINHSIPDNHVFEMQPPKNWILKNKLSFKNDFLYSRYFLDSFTDMPVNCNAYTGKIAIQVNHPLLWDAEHPNLYQLKLTLYTDNLEQQVNTYHFGFREITYGGNSGTAKNKLYINGKEIKLRGVCRHDVSHLYGRSMTREDVYGEILVYKKHNINHIRTSHYPAMEYMLDVCDELGIYVEQENPACFKGANNFGIYNPPQDFVNTFAEMIETSRNHPSVIIWSLANESGFEKSYAFRTEYKYVKAVDETRPVIFSYPHTVHSKPRPYDIFSSHYKHVTSNLGRKDMPVLHDEFAHVSCYNLKRLLYDNSSRVAWGESIKRGWDNIFRTPGALGCAIWSAVDDVFYIPSNTLESHQRHSAGSCAGYGEWGCIFDAYKREKPEAYYTKKAFSPVVVDEINSTLGKESTVLLENRFDHTYLNEVKMLALTDEGEVLFNEHLPGCIAPHSSGEIRFKNPNIQNVKLAFYHSGYLVEQSYLKNNSKMDEFVPSDNMEIAFNSLDSMLVIKSRNGHLIAKGPYFSMGGKQKQLQKIRYENGLWSALLNCNQARFKITAEYSNKRLLVKLTPQNFLASKIRLNEIGVEFILYDAIESVRWNRESGYSFYPEGHLGRNSGTAMLKRANYKATPEVYGKKPDWMWEWDMKNYFLFRKDFHAPLVTNDFKTKRSNIINYAVDFATKYSLFVKTESKNMNAYVNMFTTPENQLPKLLITQGNRYPDLQWGNYTGDNIILRNNASFEIEIFILTGQTGQ